MALTRVFGRDQPSGDSTMASLLSSPASSLILQT
jgi:hypothetical protein